jgi:hypothetical protein
MANPNMGNSNGAAPSIEEIIEAMVGMTENLIKEKDQVETHLVQALPSHIRDRIADIQVRLGLLGKNPGDARRAEAAKLLLDFVRLLGQFSTDHAKLAVMLHQLFLQALQTMHGMDYALPAELQATGKANSRKLMDILDATQEEVMTAFGERGMVELMKAITSK